MEDWTTDFTWWSKLSLLSRLFWHLMQENRKPKWGEMWLMEQPGPMMMIITSDLFKFNCIKLSAVLLFLFLNFWSRNSFYCVCRNWLIIIDVLQFLAFLLGNGRALCFGVEMSIQDNPCFFRVIHREIVAATSSSWIFKTFVCDILSYDCCRFPTEDSGICGWSQ